MRILLVEDDLADEQAITKMLAGNEFLIVRSVDECCQAVRVDEFDVVLLDLNLTNKELCRAVHCVRSADQELPIVVITTNKDREGGPAVIKHGAHEYVEKDVMDGHYLCQKIDQAIQRAKNSATDLISDLRHIRRNVSAAERILQKAEATHTPVVAITK